MVRSTRVCTKKSGTMTHFTEISMFLVEEFLCNQQLQAVVFQNMGKIQNKNETSNPSTAQ